VVRGATSALGQAAVNIAANFGAHVIATSRNAARTPSVQALGATQVLIESTELSKQVRQRQPDGVDAVLDIVGNTTVLDSLAMLRRGGRVCLVGSLGGGPLSFEPVCQIPSGRSLSVFASALVTGSPEFPLSEIPFPNDRRSRRLRHVQGQAGPGVPVRRNSGSPSPDGVESGERKACRNGLI
jgi:NADPH:quinone reductase